MTKDVDILVVGAGPVGLFTVALNPDEDRITKDSYWLGAGISAGISAIVILSSFLIGG